MAHYYRAVPVENSPVEECKGKKHHLHMGLVSLNGWTESLRVTSLPQRADSRILLPRFLKGPWRLNENSSTITLRHPLHLNTFDNNALSRLGMELGIDWSLSYPDPTGKQSLITVRQDTLAIPFHCAEDEAHVFLSNTSDVMYAAALAIGTQLVTVSN